MERDVLEPLGYRMRSCECACSGLRCRIILATVATLARSPTGTARGLIERVHGGGPCIVDEDCQLNGLCIDRKCACLAAWEGANCSLLATRPSHGPAHGLANVSSWGGRSYLWEGDGLWHGFFSEFGGSCGMDMWNNNSHIVHMTSPTPFGPKDGSGYTRQEQLAIPAFSHCVDPVRLPDGRWLLFHNGDGASRKGCAMGSPDCPLNAPGQWLASCAASNDGKTPLRRHGPLPAQPPPRPPPPHSSQSA